MAEKKTNWTMGEKFDQVMPHHSGIKALWETKWKFPCTRSVYPFHDGKFEDFKPVFEYLIANNINDGYGDAYTEAFFPAAQALTKLGDREKNLALASELYLRAACLYRISRFPYISSFPTISSQIKWEAWEAQKEVYMKAASKWESPVKEILIPFTRREGQDRESIPVYIRVPKLERGGNGNVPVVILMTGLDGYRPDNTERTNEFLSRGLGVVIVEIPGTADCPADPSDSKSCDRLWSAVLDWMENEREYGFDMSKVMVWGLSTGGYYAVRIAHTHRERLRGVIAQGAGVHEFFGEEWIVRAERHEYPFSIWPAMATKHGFESKEEFIQGAQKKFSLLENGILDLQSTRLLLVNGTHDGLMPIEDSMLLFEHGTPKEGRFFKDALHMGYPLANGAVYPWMESVMGGK